MNLIGAHVDELSAIDDASSLDVPIVQVSLGDPRSWKTPKISFPGGAEGLRSAAEEAGVGIYVHAAYVINVASTNNRIRIPSRKLLQKTLDAAASIGARGVVVHGGHVTADDDPEAGYENWFKAVDGLEISCPLLIENTAGGKNAMLRFSDSIARVWEKISASDNIEHVGTVFDTCHANGSGEDILQMIDKVREITGGISLLHLNDSRDEPGTGADRHANLGAGTLGEELLIEALNRADAPAILETPGGLEGHQADLAWLAERGK